MTRHNAWECSVAGGGTTVLAKKLERNFPQNFMKLVTDVYEKRSAVSLKVESCMTVLLESYWIIIGESWVATLFSCPPHRFYSFRCFLNVILKSIGHESHKIFHKAIKISSQNVEYLCSLLRNFKANCKGNLFFELKLYGFFEKFCEIHAQYFSKFQKTVL